MLSGYRADHFPLAFLTGSSKSVLGCFSNIIEGKASEWLRGANFFALPKKNNGIRPIAVNETLRRLAASALIRCSLSLLPPFSRQFVLRNDGCLSFATIVRFVLETDKQSFAITVDLRNAFNSVSQIAVMKAASGSEISSDTQWAYGTHFQLLFGSTVITSACGG